MNLDDRMEQQIARMQVRQREKRIAAEDEHRDRRDRIATAAMQGLLAKYGMGVNDGEMLDEAVEYADRLIARLDKEVKP